MRMTPAVADMPTSIRVLGYTFTVRPEDSEDFAEHFNGEIVHSKQEIRVVASLGPDIARETLLHEVIHGIERATATDLSEEQVRAFSRGLYAVMRDNPKLVEWLMGEK